VGKVFSISAKTLDEPLALVEDMASKASQLISSTIEKSGATEDKTRAYEISVDFPKGYYGFAVRCTEADRDVTLWKRLQASFYGFAVSNEAEEEKLILGVAAKAIPIALFSYAVENCKNKIYAVVDELAKNGRVARLQVRDLHLTLERELDEFEL
jgi:hypothetical protein